MFGSSDQLVLAGFAQFGVECRIAGYLHHEARMVFRMYLGIFQRFRRYHVKSEIGSPQVEITVYQIQKLVQFILSLEFKRGDVPVQYRTVGCPSLVEL